MGSIGDVVRGEGRLQLVLCCSSRNETKGQNLREQRGGGEGLWAAHWVFWPLEGFLMLILNYYIHLIGNGENSYKATFGVLFPIEEFYTFFFY